MLFISGLLLLFLCNGCHRRSSFQQQLRPDRIATYKIAGRFAVTSSETRHRGGVTLFVDSSGRLFVEIAKADTPLAQISFNGLEISHRSNQWTGVRCTNDGYLPYFKDEYGIELDVKDLAEALYNAQNFTEKNFEIRFFHPQEFAVGLRPSLITVKNRERLIFSLRVQQWQGLERLDAAFFELGECHRERERASEASE